MKLETRQIDDVTVISMQGKLVAGVGDELLRENVDNLLGSGCKKILIDLSRVSHIDSSGVGELVASRRISRRFGARLRLVRGSAGVERVLQIGQILPLFSIHDNEAAALAEFADETPPTAAGPQAGDVVEPLRES